MSTSRFAGQNWKSAVKRTEGDVWNPYSFDTKKVDANGSKIYEDITPSNDNYEDSYIIGEYVETSVVQTSDGDKSVHNIKAFEFGQDQYKELCAELNYAETGVPMQVWGTSILNDTLQDIEPGTVVKIQHLGKVAAKNSKRTYHKWDVYTMAEEANEAPKSKTNTTTKQSVKEEVFDAAGDDKMPWE